MKRMGSDNDKSRHGLWNETERYFDNHIQGLKSIKRQKTPSRSFVWADELKRQFTYTLKPSKCSNTDIPKGGQKAGNGDCKDTETEADKPKPQQHKKFFSDMSIEKIFVNSEYFKMKSGNSGSMSFCSGENGENRWTIETSAGKKTVPFSAEKPKEPTVISEDTAKVKKPNVIKRTESISQAEELRKLKENVDTMIQEMKLLNRDFGLVRMDLKAVEKLLRLQKQVSKSRPGNKEGAQGDIDDINLKVGKFSEEVEKAAQELRDFIDNNRSLLVENEDTPEFPDFDKVINNLHRLSETAYQPKIIQTSKGAKFEVPREIPISLYADGMLLRNTDFRKYTDITAALFLRDIQDGFFPNELWPEYPYGVPFQVTDRRCEMFSEANTEFTNSFPGNGRRLGSLFDGKPSSMVYLPPAKFMEMSADGEPEKKRPSTVSIQGHYKHAAKCRSTSHHSNIMDYPNALSVKVRFGFGKEGYLTLRIMSNERMSHFQDALFKKLCEKYHDDYVKNEDLSFDGETVPDFEMHIYGGKPFRLSEKLTLYPYECGIVDNCVINITEI